MSKKLTRRGGGVLNRLDKNYPHSIHKLGYKFFACLATLVFILSTALLAFHQNSLQKNETAYGDTFAPQKSDFNYIDEIWLEDSNAFDRNNLEKLVEYLFNVKFEDPEYLVTDGPCTFMYYIDGEEYSFDSLNNAIDTLGQSMYSFGEYNIFGGKPLSSSTLRSFSNEFGYDNIKNFTGKDPSKDILVRFGGLDWDVTYLSKDNEGNYVVTLWLATHEQEAWQKPEIYSQSGDYFKFVSNQGTGGSSKYGLYSAYSATEPSGSYYPNSYNFSYIRAATLANSGDYTTDGESSGYVGDVACMSSPFYEFSFGKLSNYIVTPSQIPWQIEGQTGLNEPLLGDKYFVTHDVNEVPWANDRLWLPSLSEVGYYRNSSSVDGLWETSVSQRTNYDSSTYPYYFSGFNLLSWLRTGVDDGVNNKAYSNYDLDTKSLPFQISADNVFDCTEMLAVRPALHLNLTEAVQNTVVPPPPGLDHNTSTSSSNPDIYQVTTENGIDFHIKSAEGFLKLSAATEKGWSFDPSWTFYLDNDITVNAAKPIGATANPFLGTFNGLGTDGYVHTINYSYSAGAFDLNTQCIFGTVGDCTIKNLVINNDIRASASVCGLIADSLAGTTCNISHVTMQGSLTSVETSAYGVGQFHGDVNLYDVSLLYTTFNAGANAYIFGDFASNCTADTCRAITNLPSGASTLATLFKGPNLNINNVYANLTLPSSVKLEALSNVQNLTITESQFDIKFSSKPSTTPKIISESTTAGNINLYDALFNCTGLTNLFTSSNYPSQSTYYYTGVYFYDPQSKKTTILDPNFTPSKWCADPHLNDGMPQLRRFVSIGDFLEQCDMNAWAREKMATQ